MGGCLSLGSLPPSMDVIRVVHFNGFVEDLDDNDYPVTVGEITGGDPPKCFVCTPAQLISFGSSSKALPPDTQLQRGHLYFLLPLSALKWEASPFDFVCLATRLTKIAKRYKASRYPQSSSPVLDLSRNTMGRRSKSGTDQRVSLMNSDQLQVKESVLVKKDGDHKMSNYRAGSWKPILETINERSFGGRSESDLRSPLIRAPMIIELS